MAGSDFSYAKRGLAVRLLYLLGATLSFLIRGSRGGQRDTRVVLCYHAVFKEQLGRFARQMRYIQSLAVSLDQILADSAEAPRVAVTFDDAFECLLDTAVPVTRALGVPISIFPVTGNLGHQPAWSMDGPRPDAGARLMSAEQLLAVSKESHCAIGSHTVTHPRLAALENAAISYELGASRFFLEQLLDSRIRYLALPHGSYDARVSASACAQGYDAILTLDEICDRDRWPPGTVGRFSVSPDMWMIEFALTVSGDYAWLYAWRSKLRKIRAKVML